jgi:hypothetical protein
LLPGVSRFPQVLQAMAAPDIAPGAVSLTQRYAAPRAPVRARPVSDGCKEATSNPATGRWSAPRSLRWKVRAGHPSTHRNEKARDMPSLRQEHGPRSHRRRRTSLCTVRLRRNSRTAWSLGPSLQITPSQAMLTGSRFWPYDDPKRRPEESVRLGRGCCLGS